MADTQVAAVAADVPNKTATSFAPRLEPTSVTTVAPAFTPEIGVTLLSVACGLYVYGTPTPGPASVVLTMALPLAAEPRAPDVTRISVALMRVYADTATSCSETDVMSAENEVPYNVTDLPPASGPIRNNRSDVGKLRSNVLKNKQSNRGRDTYQVVIE